ncbi:phosphatidylinositol kinase [Myxococcus fulvus 124B02]|nr:phosphatidylinositol kinase [Myxococcus fulvus 124B02]
MLDVFLNSTRVGAIVREEHTEIISFVLDESYASLRPRLVLGQQYEERREHRVFRQARFPGELPTFFANLLPEGALQAMVQAQFAPDSASATLAIVGEDLPGAVIVRPTTDKVVVPPRARAFDEPGALAPPVDGGLRFSLGGVQLKFSAVESAEQRFTLPFRGMGGRWILKFGSETFPKLPENEFVTMAWAAASGLNVPRHRLIAARDIEGLDERFHALGEHVFAIERYDRVVDGSRVHQEDFAQVRGLPPVMKYTGWSLEGLARFIGDLCGAEDLAEYLRRVLFLLLCCNTDAHLKNWSLIYPDGRTARLSPAYDFVCVRQYLPQELALPLAKEKALERITWEHIARVEKFLLKYGHDTDLVRTGREFVQRCLDEWARLRPLAQPEHQRTLDEHFSRSPLVRELGTT